MKRYILLAIAACNLIGVPAEAQSLPKDVKRSFDSFTEDTIYTTKYGRLDKPQGCGRDNLAIEWALVSGARGKSERLIYRWIAVDAPFSAKATWLGAVAAIVKIDDEMVDLGRPPLPAKMSGGHKDFQEAGWFELPRGTLLRIAAADDAKLRIGGIEKTCDGTIEPNMITRIKAMLAHTGEGPAGTMRHALLLAFVLSWL